MGEPLRGVSDKLDELYDKLIEVRVEMAKKLGYDNYTELAYRNMGRLDYTPEHVEKFREQIRTVITPAVDRMRKASGKAPRFGFRQYYDESLTFAGGNADPIGGKDYMVGQATENVWRALARNKGILRLHDEVRAV